MKSSGRLFFFILLNILISICTILAVLLLWDQLRGPLPGGVLTNLLQDWRNPNPSAPAPPAEPGTSETTVVKNCIPYQAVAGDTFASLAERHGISAVQLRSENGFSPQQELQAGDLLCIPVNPQGEVIIRSVVGAGDLETEYVTLENQGKSPVPLSGWRIMGGNNRTFVFPQSSQFILYPNGAVNIFTRSGANNVLQLFWGLSQPVWASGDTITLLDARGNIQATYVIP